MDRIAAALAAPGVTGIIITGPAGTGKSRVAREGLAAAASLGCETRWVVGAPAAREVPLGAFTAWVPSGVGDTAQLLRRVIDEVSSSPSGGAVVLAIDDVHLLDDLSAFVVHQIVVRGAAKVILTIRDGVPVPSAVQEMCRSGQFDRLEIDGLSLGETAAVLSAVLSGPVDSSAVQRLWRMTGGNALYLRNIVEQEVADGRMTFTGGCWRWGGDPVVPRGLIELIESRVGALPPKVADVVDVLAVAEPVDLAMLTRLADPGAVEEAETRGLITLESVGFGIEARVSHPLYAEVRRSRSAQSRLVRLRGVVATELAATADRDDVRTVVRRAALSLDSDLVPDAELLGRAAHCAVWLADLSLANRLAEACVRAGGGPEPMFVRAHALSWLGHGDEAEKVLAGMDVDRLSEAEFAQLAFLRCSNMLWACADPARAKQLIDEAESATPANARTHIDAFLTIYWFAMDRPEAARAAAKNLTVHDIPIVGSEISWALTQIAADAGRTADAVATAAAGNGVATRTLDAPQMRFNIADAEVSALLLAGRVSDALEVATDTRRQATDLPGVAELIGTAVLGRAALSAGDLPRAVELLGRAAGELFLSHPVGWGYRYRIPYATALAMGGRHQEAAAALAALDGVPRQFRLLDHERSLALAWVAASRGVVSEAIHIVRSAAERARGTGRFAAEVLCLQTAAQFGDHAVAARLDELAGIVEGPRAGLSARFASALHDGDGAELSLVSEEFEKMGDLVAAIDAAAHAALVYRRRGQRGSALTCSTRADALAARCGAVTPAQLRANEHIPLTDRQHEIVAMIGEGLSNRDIAARLNLSVRTVESHIFRAMAITGTATRDELAALLHRNGARQAGLQ